MRILIASDCYAPRLGGIETQVQDLARNLAGAGHKPIVVTATPQADQYGRSVQRDDGFPVYRTSVPLPGQLPVHPCGRKEIETLISQLHPQVMHVHAGVISPFAWQAIAAAHRQKLPVAVTFHCVLGKWAKTLGLLKKGNPLKHWERYADLSAVSTMLAREIVTAGATQVSVLPNGITVENWRLAPADLPANKPIRVVASLRWIERKRPLQVVKIFTEALQRSGSKNASLEIYGDGPLRERLAQVAAASPAAEQIQLKGRVSRAQLAQAFAQADIYLQTSPADSFCISVLEARAAGLAIVALNSSGVSDFITDPTEGLLAADEPGLCAALTRLLNDGELLQAIKAHNYRIPPALQWSQVIAQNLAAYARAIKKSSNY